MSELNFDPNSELISADVEVKNKGNITTKVMALDTGATYVMIPLEVAEILGLKPELSKESIQIITASGTEKVPLVTIESISVLGKSAGNIKAVVHDLPPRSYVDGLLGLSFLKNFNVHIKFKEGILEIV